MNKDYLIIPDCHAHPDYHNKRFTWLGKLVADLQPHTVIMLGDWADMPSLCSYDKGTKGYEGARYVRDINAAIDAQEKFFHEIRKRKKKLPRFVMLEGNHEHRINRAISSDFNQLDGIIGLDDLGFEDFGWEFVPYRGGTPGVFTADGVAYAHFLTSGIMGRPIGGIHPAYQLLTKQYQSCTQGHSHIADFCIRTMAKGRHLMGCVAGVYQDYEADFAGEANELWWRGVVHKKDVCDGVYDPNFISMHTIKKEYK